MYSYFLGVVEWTDRQTDTGIICFLYIIDTCDSAWQGARDNLVIAAFVFCIFALLSLASAAMVLAFYGKCN